uniref:uncharacterized protein LOC105350731 n=1 Tax=Fragaria vesca subsp. vesca TaxID=101020 RepID=UPI0005C83348|nr:PREDICTED: uncharacterized protein LOC105350731 [Fragaria vesca subsp. vesca]
MEASTRTVLRCVGLLSMLVLSVAAAPAPHDSLVFPNSKTKSCAKKCGVSCIPSLEDPPNYVACFGLCMVACRLIPTTYTDSGDVAYGCARDCVTSVSKVMTPVANISVSDLTSYAQGYVDSCSYSCSKNEKLF